jgi:hypothetical protein
MRRSAEEVAETRKILDDGIYVESSHRRQKYLGANDLRRQRTFVRVFLLLVCLVLARFVHDGWVRALSDTARCPPAPGTPVYFPFTPAPTVLHAPEAYRIAIPALGRLLIRIFHVKSPAYVAATLDFIFAFLALNLFCRLTGADVARAEDGHTERILTPVLFLGFIQFSLVWVVPWQRPETLPSALFLAVSLLSVARAPERGVWSAVLLMAAVCQTFVRSDVAFIFGIALVAFSLTGNASKSLGSRRSNLIKGLSVTLIAGGGEAYLQFVRYPHLHYWPGTDVIQFRNNLHFHNLSNCVLALLPFLLLGVVVAVKRIRLSGIDTLILISSVLYLALWFTVGIVQEVRIYVPFLLALCVVAARTSALLLRRAS